MFKFVNSILIEEVKYEILVRIFKSITEKKFRVRLLERP